MAIRSTTSQFQPIPPNYTSKAGPFHNIGRYKAVTADRSTQKPVSANMSTAPVRGNNSAQYFYAPGLNG